MLQNIYFDHTFTKDENFQFLLSLEKYGFKIKHTKLEHPDCICSFIKFKESKYLEFIEFTQKSAYHYRPGISFGYRSDLQEYQRSISKKILTEFKHKNYDWKNNSVDYLPGWSFVNFTKLNIRGFYPWFTEY